MSPLGGQALVVGLVIAFTEIAVGAATLAGLWARKVAALGLLVSFGFLLTVSWHTRPYYYGADIVFVFAWTPLVIAGAGPWSVDAWAKREARISMGLKALAPVSLEFANLQRFCGAYEKGRCRARDGSPCRAEGCPVLANPVPIRAVEELDRRTLLKQAGAAGWLGIAAAVGGGLVAILGRVIPPRPSSRPGVSRLAGPPPAGTGSTTTSAGGTTTPTAGVDPSTVTTAPHPPVTAALPAGTAIGPASDVPVGGAAQFTVPSTGDPAYVLHPTSGTFLAFDAICTHAGCTVNFTGQIFVCPCHGAEFNATNGGVLRGPARRALSQVPLQLGSDGNLYVT